ncbi:hypothetical protein BS47DRAFT_1452145 [Hydnum rufescens UP504]|uniref:U3 small nucleolar RNA-associated protein 11 n=1 Tax=Hydnum rufescens UP504 TaxID=1448309 RepID=A0A9P6AZF2_9AGAM|nr:hypothetical protein BS47DRAFT_1452145 [Hydnum rufescens UP504]
MVGSSLRNAVHRRNHKERSQLVNRGRLGLLEKKKDYVQRARDYRSKKDRLKRLQEKAATRNKDEFYFSMIRARTQEGVHIQERGNVAIPVEMVKFLKSQDENYIRTMRAANTKKIDSIKAELATLINLVRPDRVDPEAPEEWEDGDLEEDDLQILRSAGILPLTKSAPKKSKKRSRTPPPTTSGTHIVFPRKYRPRTPSAPKPPVDLGWIPEEERTTKKTKRKALHTNTQETELETQLRMQGEEAKAHRALLLKELSARLERDQSLRYAQLEVKSQRLRMSSGARKLIPAEKKGKQDPEDLDNPGGFTFNTKAEDSDSDDGDRGPGGERKWKPKVYKWKFERKN